MAQVVECLASNSSIKPQYHQKGKENKKKITKIGITS
jgi:hypothetical protein